MSWPPRCRHLFQSFCNLVDRLQNDWNKCRQRGGQDIDADQAGIQIMSEQDFVSLGDEKIQGAHSKCGDGKSLDLRVERGQRLPGETSCLRGQTPGSSYK